MTAWRWKADSIAFAAKCFQCAQLLRPDPNIVTYQGDDYHVGCLLDRLTGTIPEPEPQLAPSSFMPVFPLFP